MYALIHNDTIIETRHTLPATWERDGQLWDIRPGQHSPEAAGWREVTIQPRPDDTDTHTHERSIDLIDGAPTVVWTPRDWTEQETRDRAESAAIADLDARLRAVEAHLWPPAADDAPAADAPTWEQLVPPHHWPNGTLMVDTDGRVWRNTSGDVLTRPPSQFPGTPEQWAHLFVEHGTAPDPDPDPDPDPEWPQWRGEWSADAYYTPGDHVTREGVVYRCIAAHGPEQQGAWGPPVTGVWVTA